MIALQSSSPRYALQVRLPVAFGHALKTVADRKLMPVSVLVRQILVDRLKAEGIDPAALISADMSPSRDQTLPSR